MIILVCFTIKTLAVKKIGSIGALTNFGIVFLDTGFWQKVATQASSCLLSQAVAGKGGADAVLVVIFMSCTSIKSVQLNAISSIFSFDIYGTYINKKVTNKQIIRCNATSSFVPLPITIAISLIWPNRTLEWSDLLSVKRVEDDAHGDVSASASHFGAEAYFSPERLAYMERMARLAFYWGVATFAAQWVLWPLLMYGARFVFSSNLFIARVIVALI
ncbi:hypothetical protein LTR85_003707 [Meristemomyces frigidus]|nr:hypothetical protein LTR85_003707 [Meristemomyces frigidus]